MMTKKNNAKYWASRMDEQEERVQEINDAYLAEMERQLIAYQQTVIDEINVFYARYANDNRMTLAEAERYLTNNELEIFQNITLEDFRQLSLDPRTEIAYLDALSFRHRISRKEALLKEIELETLKLYGNVDGLSAYVYKNMGQVYGESKIVVAHGLGEVGINFRRPILDIDTVKNKLKVNWSGRNLSEVIWGQEQKLYDDLVDVLDEGLRNDRRLADIIEDVVERTGVARSRVETLVRTESNAFNTLGNQDEFNNQFIEFYKNEVTRDHLTSNICTEISRQDKVHRVEDMEIGLNAPPFHVRCRTITVPYFGDELDTYFEVDDGYDGPELDDVLGELTSQLEATLNNINNQL